MTNMKFISLIALVGLSACTTVDNGTRGVFVEYGKATSSASEGFYWYNPWSTDVVVMDVQSQKWSGKTIAYTRDVQQANVQFALTYHLDPSSVLAIYKQYGTAWSSKIVPQVVYQSIKSTVGKARAVEDVINNRQAVTSLIFDDIAKRLTKHGIVVDGFEIQDVGFNEAFESAVERKQVAVQDAETARNNTVKIQEEARQAVIKAEGEAKAMATKTAALAGSPKLVEYEAVQRWNGVLPSTIYGGSVPFVKVIK